jgi:V-type H+-transporting ATPase subunit a
MGIFAFYCGWIYNEFFAIPLEVFGSCYEEEIKVLSNKKNTTDGYNDTWDPNTYGYKRINGNSLTDDCVYTIGIDPRWAQSDMLLSYTNNFKMKLAVILAILQMSMGIIMKGLNSLYFKKPLDFIFEFIPQIILILVLFGWMDVLIIAKWMYPRNAEINSPPLNTITNTTNPYDDPNFSAISLAPSIITTMIGIFLS